MSILGDFIQKKRLEKGWSYRRLEKESGVSYGTIESIESGKSVDPGYSKVVKLARALGISQRALILAADGIDPSTLPEDEQKENQSAVIDALEALVENLKNQR